MTTRVRILILFAKEDEKSSCSISYHYGKYLGKDNVTHFLPTYLPINIMLSFHIYLCRYLPTCATCLHPSMPTYLPSIHINTSLDHKIGYLHAKPSNLCHIFSNVCTPCTCTHTNHHKYAESQLSLAYVMSCAFHQIIFLSSCSSLILYF